MGGALRRYFCRMSQAKKQQDYKLKLLGINSPKD